MQLYACWLCIRYHTDLVYIICNTTESTNWKINVEAFTTLYYHWGVTSSLLLLRMQADQMKNLEFTWTRFTRIIMGAHLAAILMQMWRNSQSSIYSHGSNIIAHIVAVSLVLRMNKWFMIMGIHSAWHSPCQRLFYLGLSLSPGCWT